MAYCAESKAILFGNLIDSSTIIEFQKKTSESYSTDQLFQVLNQHQLYQKKIIFFLIFDSYSYNMSHIII